VDVQEKLDEITSLVEQARAMPMSASCIVNRPELLTLLEELRALLPEEIDLAEQLLAGGELPDLNIHHPWPLPVESAIELARRCEAAAFAVDPTRGVLLLIILGVTSAQRVALLDKIEVPRIAHPAERSARKLSRCGSNAPPPIWRASGPGP
jgi:hypothetical protein